MELTELPLLPATVFDRVAIDPDESVAGLKKTRQELRKQIGLGSEGFLSIGRRGSINLDPIPLFSWAKTQRYWGSKKLESHIQAYRNAGLQTFLKSRDYQNVLSVATRELQTRMKAQEKDDVLTAAVRVLSELFSTDERCRRVAVQMGEITIKVDEALTEVERTPGELVRFEGDEALLVLHRRDRDELRLLDASLFASSGLSDGSTFVLQEFSWTPDATVRLVIPAVSLTGEFDEAVLKSLDAYDTPLPRP